MHDCRHLLLAPATSEVSLSWPRLQDLIAKVSVFVSKPRRQGFGVSLEFFEGLDNNTGLLSPRGSLCRWSGCRGTPPSSTSTSPTTSPTRSSIPSWTTTSALTCDSSSAKPTPTHAHLPTRSSRSPKISRNSSFAHLPLFPSCSFPLLAFHSLYSYYLQAEKAKVEKMLGKWCRQWNRWFSQHKKIEGHSIAK